MAKVWESSQHAGSDLLMLLAIADFSDDDGNAFPAVATLAGKCRMKERNCRYILRTLEKSGELSIRPNAGPHGSNLYHINLGSLGLQHGAGGQSLAGLQHSAVTPAKDCRQPLQHIAAKPPMTHQETLPMVDGFAAFWEEYPKKVAKPKALAAWKKQKPDLAACLSALSVAKTSPDWMKNGGQFIPYPATWLNGRRFEDEQAVPPAPAANANPVFAGAI